MENDIILTLENAKEYYKNEYCNTFLMFEKRDFYFKNFDKDTFLKWNDEKINEKLDEIEKMLELPRTLDNARMICFEFSLLNNIYTTEYNTYKRIISFLKKLYNKYGYFMNYYLYDVDRDSRVFGDFARYYIRIYHSTNQLLLNAASSYFYDSERKYDGLMPNLHYLGYMDLFDEYINDCFIPIVVHFHEKNDLMIDNDVYYCCYKGIEHYSLFTLFKEFILKYDIKIPEKLNKALEQFQC